MTVTAKLSTPNPARSRIGEPGYRTWRAKLEATGGCAHPIHLSGQWALQHTATEQTLARRAGQVMVACGNRRESVCPACSDRYAADAFHLLRAGLAGDEAKHIPARVADKPRLFLTLTAPSFGPVHNRRLSRNGKTQPCRCGAFHSEHDTEIGQPLDPESYDYTGHVLWQAHAGELWDRFARALRRHLAKAAGIPVRAFPEHARISFAKVAEFQRRGLVHFHAVLRLDGPGGPADPTPSWGDTALLTDAVHAAHAAAYLNGPELGDRRHVFTFGEQIDLRPIRPANAAQLEDEAGQISEDRLASYVAKYATKGTATSEAADKPIRSEAHIDRLPATPHHRRIIRTAWHLGAPVPCPACHPDGEHDPEGCACAGGGHCELCAGGGWVSRTTARDYRHPELAGKPEPLDRLRLRKWAHMLAFRGHFLSKSQHYSVPFRDIRQARTTYRHQQALAELGIDDASEITVINTWAVTHIGHDSTDQRDLAEAIAYRNRELRQAHADQRKEHP
jgi:hypothetical protein